MNETTLWSLPVPSSGLEGGGSVLRDLPGREVAIRFTFERDDVFVDMALIFVGVEAFRVTYMTALEPVMLKAYDKLVDRGSTDWLTAVRAQQPDRGHAPSPIKHLMITFDDGPCYEAICKSFRVDDDPTGLARDARARMRDLADQILSGAIDLFAGTRTMVGLMKRLPADESSAPDLAIFIAVDSELDDIPMGAVRSKWAPEALAEKDRQRADYLSRAREQIEEACRTIRRREP